MSVDWHAIPWEDLIPRWQLWTYNRLRWKYWRGIPRGPIPAGNLAEDFVYDAILKVIDGKRSWDPKKISLYWIVIGIIRGDINRRAVSHENTTTVSFDRDDDSERHVLNIEDYQQSPAAVAETRSEYAALHSFLTERDPALAELAKLMLEEEETRPRELSLQLDIAVKDVNTLKKRLKRAVTDYLRMQERECSDGSHPVADCEEKDNEETPTVLADRGQGES